MQAIQFYETPGIAQTYIGWCVKANGCAPADAIIKIIKERNEDRDFSKGTIVDLGSGPGTSVAMLMHVFHFEKCVMVDASGEMINFVKDYYRKSKRVSTLKADLRKDGLDIPSESAEVVISCSTIPYLDSVSKFISESSRILKPGGYLGFNGYFHTENDLNPRSLHNDFGVEFYHHSYRYLHQLLRAAGLEEIASVKIEKSKEEKQIEDFFKVVIPENQESKKEEVYNRLMVFEKH